MSDRVDIDLGHGHTLEFYGWHPDRNLNPQYAEVPDIERHAAMVRHVAPSGEPCIAGITLDSPEARKLVDLGGSPYRLFWTVESWEPLTVSPSLLCSCGDHGFIREGKWVPA